MKAHARIRACRPNSTKSGAVLCADTVARRMLTVPPMSLASPVKSKDGRQQLTAAKAIVRMRLAHSRICAWPHTRYAAYVHGRTHAMPHTYLAA